MIPLRIEVKNFRSIPYLDMDLSDIGLAAVIGRNGAGKSSVFTGAPIFALFGYTAAGSADDAVRLGETECYAAFTFEHRNDVYRVIRSRSKGGRGKSGLELQRRTPGGESEFDIGTFSWASLSGATIRDTQERIEKLIGLDAETFTSASMILQGKANEFTAKAPGQRKAILGRILGLDAYETLREGAKKHAADAGKKLFALDEEIRVLDEEIMAGGDVDGDISGAENQIVERTARVEFYESELRELQIAIDRAAKDREAYDEKLRAAEELGQRARETADRARGANETIAEIDKYLEREPVLIERARRNEEMKLLRAGLAGKIARRDQLRGDIASLKEEIATLTKACDETEVRLLQIRQFLERKPQYEKEAAEYIRLEQEANDDAEKAEIASMIEAEINGREKERLRIASDLKSNELIRRGAGEKAARLEKSGCVNLAAAESSPCAFLRDAIEAKRKLPALEAEEKELNAQMSKTLAEIEEAKVTLNLLGYSKSVVAARNERMKKLKPAADGIAGFASKEELASELAARVESYAVKIAKCTEKQKALAGEMALLDKDLADSACIDLEITETELAVKELAEIPARRANRAALAEKVRDCEIEHAGITDKINALEREIGNISIPDVSKIEERIAEKTALIPSMRRELDNLHAALGALKKVREGILNSRAKAERLKSEIKPLARLALQWETLERAFSRDGIPALIIENAVPELERISNEILGEMSNGEHSLRFETQRELKSKDGMAETLDIIVSDWQGERPYETLSGGEASRCDLAIRTALSEFLANRAGAKIEWLTMDETFNDQDSEHKPLVIDAIKAISDRFKKVIVITHDETLLGAFPRVINLSRGESGLTVEVSAA